MSDIIIFEILQMGKILELSHSHLVQIKIQPEGKDIA